MEYYPAGSLLNFIRHHTLTWTQLMRVVHSIAAGLAYLHQENDTSGLYQFVFYANLTFCFQHFTL